MQLYPQVWYLREAVMHIETFFLVCLRATLCVVSMKSQWLSGFCSVIFQASAFIAYLISVSLLLFLLPLLCHHCFKSPCWTSPPPHQFATGPRPTHHQVIYPRWTSLLLPLSFASSSSKQCAGTCWQKSCSWGVRCSLKKVSNLKAL